MTFSVFLLYLAAGLGVGIADRSLSPLRTRVGKIFTVLSDVVLALLLVGLHAAIMFGINDGQFFFYAAAGELLTYIVGRAIVAAVIRGFHSLRHRRQKSANTR